VSDPGLQKYNTMIKFASNLESCLLLCLYAYGLYMFARLFYLVYLRELCEFPE